VFEHLLLFVISFDCKIGGMKKSRNLIMAKNLLHHKGKKVKLKEVVVLTSCIGQVTSFSIFCEQKSILLLYTHIADD
jgi:hypothetical protein